MTLISTISFILGILALVLVILGRFSSHKTSLVVGALVLFAIAIGTFLAQPAVPVLPSVQVPTPILTEELIPVSPVSPVSAVPTPQPTLVEVSLAEMEFEGCLLFSSDLTGDFEIYKLQDRLDNRLQLTDSPGLDIEPSWSPDGSKIVFASNRQPDVGLQIYVMAADGSNQTRLGDIQLGDNAHPSWSPDGSKIVFQSNRDTNSNPLDDNLDVFLMNSDGSDVKFLISHPADDSEPVWSPNQNKIAFLSERSGQDQVYLIDVDSSNLEQLTQLDSLKSGLNWSRDGRSIIFESNGDIYSVNVETKELTKILSLDASNEATPAWLQKENFIVFSSDRAQNWDLYALNKTDPDNYFLAPITQDAAIDRSPSWFPCN